MTVPPPRATLSRRLVLSGLLAAAAAVPALAEGVPDVRPPPRPARFGGKAPTITGPSVARLIEEARLGGRVGLAVIDAVTGEVVEAAGADDPLPPASCLKAVTALYALDRLGAGHAWLTQLIATGPVAGGVVQGDLVLSGSGDPTLTTDHLGDLAARLRTAGVTGVTGRFLVHAGGVPRIDRIDPDQPDHAGYNPALCGLNLNYNRVHFEWRRGRDGWLTTMDARGERFVPAVRMARIEIAARESPLFTYRQRERAEDWTVAAAALGNGGARWLPVRLPELYAGEVFQTLCAAQGIRLPDPAVAGRAPAGQLVARVASDTLGPVLRDCLRYSTNLTAEVVGLTASGAGSLRTSGEAMADWVRARTGVVGRFVDHSGLGGASRVTAADFARILAAGRDGPLPGLLRAYGMRAADGSERRDHPVQVVAKTGTLNFVSGLAGYILPPQGRRLAFAIFCADTARRDGLAAADRESPAGGQAWTRRARTLQARLVGRWGALVA